MPSLTDTKTATSSEKVDGVNIKGTSTHNTGNVSIKNKTTDTYATQAVREDTNVDDTTLGNGKYSITNNSGGTINYKWL